jgi:hypothetical protein
MDWSAGIGQQFSTYGEIQTAAARDGNQTPHGMPLLVTRAGLEPGGPVDKAQVIDFIKRQKRSNRYFRRFEVHGGYTGYEFVSRQRGKK